MLYFLILGDLNLMAACFVLLNHWSIRNTVEFLMALGLWKSKISLWNRNSVSTAVELLLHNKRNMPFGNPTPSYRSAVIQKLNISLG